MLEKLIFSIDYLIYLSIFVLRQSKRKPSVNVMKKKEFKKLNPLGHSVESGSIDPGCNSMFRCNMILPVNGIPSKPGVLGLPVLRRVLLPIIILNLLLLSL